ncbi:MULTISPECIES: methionine ABC transporter permease [unclassified Cetobacterium]|uniref:methionine ABC transporter permease n=1 Tax=unclassified Cetobacterium TaxID=2630983 RepID=UPI00163D1F5B|nr:methionine ABC transporter permease [Cetobacterium sp. 8H]MBC2852086.1 ABC transporter permease [Cetobacterium sp. 8H]
MEEKLYSYLGNVIKYQDEMINAIGETLIMVGIAGTISTILGTIMGIVLVITRKGGILENSLINSILGKIINIFRSIPFVILLAALIPVTRFFMGTTIGLKGAIVPLIFGSAPFVARQIESALLSVDSGVIEAAYAMGSSPFEIIYRVLLREALPEIIYALIITTVSLIGFSAVAGTVGGGGLGDFAIRYGYQHFKTDIMVVTIIILITLITFIQWSGEKILKKIKR